jgi:hypothetical protein
MQQVSTSDLMDDEMVLFVGDDDDSLLLTNSNDNHDDDMLMEYNQKSVNGVQGLCYLFQLILLIV